MFAHTNYVIYDDPHVCLVTLSGFRVREAEMLALGMSLPGLAQRAGAIAGLPALGLLTLAALTPAPWTQSYHEAPKVDEALVASVLGYKPALVAISALTAAIGEAYSLADTLRNEGVRVVLGGLHVTAMPDEALSHADAVVVGEGEPHWAALLADARAGRLRARYEGGGFFDLSRAPVPRFDLLGDRERPRFTVQTARGCPLACEFCGASRLLGPFREKPLARIEAELQAISSIARRPQVELADDNTFAGRRDAGEFLAMLGRSGVRYFTECDWRIGERPEVLERLAASGCAQVLVGVESLVPRHTGMGAKRVPLPRIVDALCAVQNAGVPVIGCFVVGGEGETLESLQQLGDFLMNAPFADVQLTLQTPFPGTVLYRRLSAQGRMLPHRSWESHTLFDVTYQPDVLSVEQLERGFRNLVAMNFAAQPSTRRQQIRRDVWARRQTP